MQGSRVYMTDRLMITSETLQPDVHQRSREKSIIEERGRVRDTVFVTPRTLQE